MKLLTLVIALLGLLTAFGCRYEAPTSVSPMNNSGKFVTGNLIIEQEAVPFDSLSIHIGAQTVRAGYLVEANLINVWTDEHFHLTGRVPACPTDDPYATLIVELDKTQNLNLYWKTEVGSLKDIYLEQYYRNFMCLPIVVANRGPRKDYVVDMKQGPQAQSFLCTDHDSNLDCLYYGFVHQDENLPPSSIFVSYIQKPALAAHCCKLPTNLSTLNKNVSALFLVFAQDDETARLYLLEDTSTNPRIIAEDLQEQRIQLPLEHTDFPTFRIQSEVRRYGYRLPNIKDLE